MSHWTSLARAAKLCNVSPSITKRLVQDGIIHVRRLPGGRPQVNTAEIRIVLANHTRREVAKA